MNFEDSFKHYKDGSATAEEIEYVEEELAKAKALSTLLDDDALTVTPPALEEADINEVRAAKRQYTLKRIVVSAAAFALTLLIIGAILGGVFGSAASYAKKGIVFNKETCSQLAVDYAYTFASNGLTLPYSGSKSEFKVKDIDAKFNFENKIKKSYYVYRVKIYANIGLQARVYEVDVNTKTGMCTIHDVEWDD